MPLDDARVGFFDAYPRFQETSQTGPHLNRLNKRHQAIFETLPGLVKGLRVLDIASHDGRWSFAALKAGAASVVGVEPREHLVAHANETLAHYGCPPESYRFEQADIFDYLQASAEPFDAVLCLGFFYHTYRHPELMAQISRRRPRVLVIDSAVLPEPGPRCEVRLDRADQEYDAAQELSTWKGLTFAALPTADLLKMFIDHYGFSWVAADWRAIIDADGNREMVEPYDRGSRITLICHRRPEVSDGADAR